MNLRRLSSVSLGHFAIDVLNSSIAMIITGMAVPFNLSNSDIGLGVMVYQIVGSLSQPYFGWLADRFSGRWLGTIGLLWTATFYFAATYATNYPYLLLMMSLASLGSAAFHPQGAMNASAAGGGRASSATAIFFLLGQMGLALGPVFAGYLLEGSGMAGPRIMALASLPAVGLLAYGLYHPLVRRTASEIEEDEEAETEPGLESDHRWMILTAFGILVAMRATVQSGYYGLLPKFFADMGIRQSEYGVLVGIFSAALAVGTLAGGVLGDRYRHRPLLIWISLITVPFTYLMLEVQGPIYWILAASAGFLLGIPHSIVVVMAQRLLPNRQGLASGAVLGFMFATGAVGTGFFGLLADRIGMSASLHIVALLPIGAALSAMVLPRRRTPNRQLAASGE